MIIVYVIYFFLSQRERNKLLIILFITCIRKRRKSIKRRKCDELMKKVYLCGIIIPHTCEKISCGTHFLKVVLVFVRAEKTSEAVRNR